MSDASSHAPPAGAPRRVLLAESSADGTVGGSHQVLYDVARHLDRRRFQPVALFYEDNRFVGKLRDAGVEVHLMTDQWNRERRAMASGNRIRQVAMLVEAVTYRVRFLARQRIDLLHINNSPQIAHDDWLPAARIRRIPAIANFAGNVRFDVSSPVHRMLMRGFDKVMPVSRHVEQQVLAFGYRPDRVEMIHPGIDVEAFRARVRRAPESMRAELAVTSDAFVIAMVGNVRAWKGQHVAIAALSRLSSEERARMRLMIVGATAAVDAAYERSLHELVHQEGLNEQVVFLGRRDDVPDIVGASDVVLHASTDAEPFGLVVVEGMALGRVVVVSKLGGPSEIIDSGSGLTFSPESPDELATHLSMLQAAPDRRRLLGEAGRQRAEKFDIRNTVASDMGVYDEVLGTAKVMGQAPRLL
jgi:glycosyltransferase involved in cell wall biosynthesis